MLEKALVVSLSIVYLLSPLVIHEMGHWMVLHRFKVSIAEYWIGLGPCILRVGKLRVGMFPIGGAVVPEEGSFKQLAHKHRLLVALAGPIASLIYGCVALAVWYALPQVEGIRASYSIAMLNFVLAGVNALPVPPLDGFQAYTSYREIRGNPISSRRLAMAYRAGNGFVYGIGFVIVGSLFLK